MDQAGAKRVKVSGIAVADLPGLDKRADKFGFGAERLVARVEVGRRRS